MKAKQAVKRMIEESGETGYSVAKKMGMNNNYVYTLLTRPTEPNIGTLTKIADVCGYDIVAQKRDDDDISYKIDPPE